MINGRFLKALGIVASTIVLLGCSGYNKLIKSGDHELMYKKALEYYDAQKYQRTLQLLEEISPFYSSTTREDTILYYTGASHYKMGDFESSGMIFDDFRRRFGRSPYIEDVEYMYAKGFYFSSPSPERDQTTTQQALIAINEYLDRYPNSVKKEALLKNIEELKLKLYDKSFINARSYYTTGRYKSAVTALKNALNKYPETPHREDLLYLTAKSSYLLARNSLPQLQRDRYLDMMDAYYNFASEFPDSKYRKELDRMQAEAKDFLARHNPDDKTVQNQENKDNIQDNGNEKK